MKNASIPRSNKYYDKALLQFKKQFKDVVSLTEIYVNGDNKVYAGQWIDSKGVINFNSGWAIDCVKIVKFID